MRLVFMGDVHFCHKAPRGRTDNYAREILAKLAWIAKFASNPKIAADFVISTGDLFHWKAPEERDITSLIKAFKAFPRGRIFSIIGNHDSVTPGRMDGTAYECLVAAKVVTDFSDKTLYLNRDAETNRELPGSECICLTGRAYRREADMRYHASPVVRQFEGEIVVSHGMLVAEDRPYPFPCTSIQKCIGEGRAPTLLVNGHNHRPFEDETGNLVNLGAICRVSRAEAGPRRILYVVVKEGRIEKRFVNLPIKEDDEVFNAEETFDAEAAGDEGKRDTKIRDFVNDVANDKDSLSMDPNELLDRMADKLGSPEAVNEARVLLDKAKERLRA